MLAHVGSSWCHASIKRASPQLCANLEALCCSIDVCVKQVKKRHVFQDRSPVWIQFWLWNLLAVASVPEKNILRAIQTLSALDGHSGMRSTQLYRQPTLQALTASRQHGRCRVASLNSRTWTCPVELQSASTVATPHPALDALQVEPGFIKQSEWNCLPHPNAHRCLLQKDLDTFSKPPPDLEARTVSHGSPEPTTRTKAQAPPSTVYRTKWGC